MARKVHPVQDASSSKDGSKACSYSLKQISFFDLEQSLDILTELYSKQQQIPSENEANDVLEENVDLLDLCQVLTDRINKAKSYTDLLTSVSRSLDAVQAEDSVQSTSLSAKASKAITIAAKYNIPRLSSAKVAVVKAARNLKSCKTFNSATLMKTTCDSLSIASQDDSETRLNIRGVFKKVLRRCGPALRELEVAHKMIMHLQKETKNSKAGFLQLPSLKESSLQLKKSTAELEKGVSGVERKLQKLYQSLLSRQMGLLQSF